MIEQSRPSSLVHDFPGLIVSQSLRITRCAQDVRSINCTQTKTHPLKVNEADLPAVLLIRVLAQEDVCGLRIPVNHRSPPSCPAF